MPKDNSQSQDADHEYNFPSLDLVFELTKERIKDQMEQVNTLDGKANFIIGSASALLSAALILQAVLLTSQSLSCPMFANRFLRTLPLLILLIIYLVAMSTAFLAYGIRVYKHAPEPDELYRNYLSREEKNTKAERTEFRIGYADHDFNYQHHFAHEQREDGGHSPAAVLRFVKGIQPVPNLTYRVFSAICETRTLSKARYAKFRCFPC